MSCTYENELAYGIGLDVHAVAFQLRTNLLQSGLNVSFLVTLVATYTTDQILKSSRHFFVFVNPI